MYRVEGKICGFKVVKGAETFFICFDKSQVKKIGDGYFVPAVSDTPCRKRKESIFALEVTKENEQPPKESEKYILEIEGTEDLLKNYIGKRITVKFAKVTTNKKVRASEILFID